MRVVRRLLEVGRRGKIPSHTRMDVSGEGGKGGGGNNVGFFFGGGGTAITQVSPFLSYPRKCAYSPTTCTFQLRKLRKTKT